MPVSRTCQRCGKEFAIRPSRIKPGWGIYCSKSCALRSRKYPSLEERFWKHVNKRGLDECWEWTGYKPIPSQDYGALGTPRILAHRYSWMLANGKDIPEGLKVLHSCDNPACVNPAHLRLGTQLDNIHDRDARGRRKPKMGEENPRAKLTWDKVRVARAKYIPRRGSIISLAIECGISSSAMSCVIHNKTWKE